MPSTLSYPGIYIEEVASPVRTVVGVPTAVAAFVGRARLGPVDRPVRIKGFGDFERNFGGLWSFSELGHAVQQYFQNGGADAYVVRVAPADASTLTFTPPGGGNLPLTATNPGAWANGLKISVDHDTRDVSGPGTPAVDEFNLKVELSLKDPVSGQNDITTEVFRNVSVLATSPTFVKTVLDNSSNLIAVSGVVPGARPAEGDYEAVGNASDGSALTASDLAPTTGPQGKKGMFLLEDAEIFTILVIPSYSPNEGVAPLDVPASVWSAGLQYCRQKRAMLIVNPPTTWVTKDKVKPTDIDQLRDKNSVTYFPDVYFADPLIKGQPRLFSPAGAMAGVMARTDQERGVWKAPAGEEAKINAAMGLQYTLTDPENGDLNPLAINCLRTFPIVGSVCWGARTLAGADAQASEWKYLPVRRTALFLEETLYRSTRWIIFEPNDEPLWSQIRLNIGAFLQSLYRQGAFQGATPKQAYFVKCDAETTTQDDINKGIVNILVGFAPLKPVEFVVIKFSQLAGQIPV
ncbi:phage tail sheath family protein [Tundrisphaera lichenicola]|uniref:phage tail sheath family protein n=1 Tax=Tundrisphaera lichenicola TaxID=2029860 RepID=UPI003EBB4F72